MKKYKIRLCYILPIVCIVCWFNSAYALFVRMDLQDTPITVNEQFDVEVWADDVIFPDSILSFGFDVSIDSHSPGVNSNSLSYSVNINESFFYDWSDSFLNTDVVGNIMPTPLSALPLSFVDYPPIGAVPEFHETSLLLATLSFTATEAGEFNLGISSFGTEDPFNQGVFTPALPSLPTIEPTFIPLSTIQHGIDSELSVTVAPVPEPATMLLFASGLAGLVGLRRKKS